MKDFKIIKNNMVIAFEDQSDDWKKFINLLKMAGKKLVKIKYYKMSKQTKYMITEDK